MFYCNILPFVNQLGDMRETKAQSVLFFILYVLLVYIVLKVHHINSFLPIVIKDSH